MWRPDIVWFGEPLPPVVWRAAVDAVRRADLVFVVGTSGLVQPAASLATARYAPRAYVIEINPDTTVLSDHVDASIRATASAILPQVVAEIG
jgi:NAD-dependent deacetylase